MDNCKNKSIGGKCKNSKNMLEVVQNFPQFDYRLQNPRVIRFIPTFAIIYLNTQNVTKK